MLAGRSLILDCGQTIAGAIREDNRGAIKKYPVKLRQDLRPAGLRARSTAAEWGRRVEAPK